MPILPVLHFFSTLAYVFLTVYVFLKNPKSPLNRICALLFGCFALWCAGKIITHNPYISEETALFPMKFVIVGAWGFSPLLLWLTLLVTEKKRVLSWKWIYPAMFAIPVVCMVSQWIFGNILTYERHEFGWGLQWRDNLLAQSLLVYIFFLIVFSLFLIFHFAITAKIPLKRRQATIVGISLFVGFFVGYGTNIVVPQFTTMEIPDLAHNMALIWAVGLVYAIIKYKFLAFTPATAADKIIATMSDALILVDPEGKIVTVNQATLDLLGYDPGDLERKDVDILFPHENRDSTFLRDKMMSQPTKNAYATFLTKFGKGIPMSFSSSQLFGEENTLVGIVCIARDITGKTQAEKAIRQAYEELKSTQTQLIQSAKLASIGEMAAGVAHELNQPLMVIRGNVQLQEKLLKKGDFDIEQLLRQTELMEKNTTRMMNIINHLRTFSRDSKKAFSPLKINEVIEDCFLMIGEQLRLHDIEVRKDFPPDLPDVKGNANQLEQVFLNLITNGRDAIEEKRNNGGSSEQGDVLSIMMRHAVGENMIDILIRDTGSGIPQEHLDKIYDPFFTTKEVGKGTGLGLSISYGIIKEHQGQIELQETSSRGTVFRVRLPIEHRRNT